MAPSGQRRFPRPCLPASQPACHGMDVLDWERTCAGCAALRRAARPRSRYGWTRRGVPALPPPQSIRPFGAQTQHAFEVARQAVRHSVRGFSAAAAGILRAAFGAKFKIKGMGRMALCVRPELRTAVVGAVGRPGRGRLWTESTSYS